MFSIAFLSSSNPSSVTTTNGSSSSINSSLNNLDFLLNLLASSCKVQQKNILLFAHRKAQIDAKYQLDIQDLIREHSSTTSSSLLPSTGSSGAINNNTPVAAGISPSKSKTQLADEEGSNNASGSEISNDPNNNSPSSTSSMDVKISNVFYTSQNYLLDGQKRASKALVELGDSISEFMRLDGDWKVLNDLLVTSASAPSSIGGNPIASTKSRGLAGFLGKTIMKRSNVSAAAAALNVRGSLDIAAIDKLKASNSLFSQEFLNQTKNLAALESSLEKIVTSKNYDEKKAQSMKEEVDASYVKWREDAILIFKKFEDMQSRRLDCVLSAFSIYALSIDPPAADGAVSTSQFAKDVSSLTTESLLLEYCKQHLTAMSITDFEKEYNQTASQHRPEVDADGYIIRPVGGAAGRNTSLLPSSGMADKYKFDDDDEGEANNGLGNLPKINVSISKTVIKDDETASMTALKTVAERLNLDGGGGIGKRNRMSSAPTTKVSGGANDSSGGYASSLPPLKSEDEEIQSEAEENEDQRAAIPSFITSFGIQEIINAHLIQGRVERLLVTGDISILVGTDLPKICASLAEKGGFQVGPANALEKIIPNPLFIQPVANDSNSGNSFIFNHEVLNQYVGSSVPLFKYQAVVDPANLPFLITPVWQSSETQSNLLITYSHSWPHSRSPNDVLRVVASVSNRKGLVTSVESLPQAVWDENARTLTWEIECLPDNEPEGRLLARLYHDSLNTNELIVPDAGDRVLTVLAFIGGLISQVRVDGTAIIVKDKNIISGTYFSDSLIL